MAPPETSRTDELVVRAFSCETIAEADRALRNELTEVWLNGDGGVSSERLGRLMRAIEKLSWFAALSTDRQRAMIVDGYKLLSLDPTLERRVAFAAHWATVARDDQKRSRFEQLRQEGRLAA